MKTLKQLKALAEEARLYWTHDQFCFYKDQLEQFVLQQYLLSNQA